MTQKLSDRLWRFAPALFLLLWAGGYSFAKLGLNYIEPMTFLAIRFVVAMLILTPICFWLGRDKWPARGADWLALGFTGLLIQGVYFGGSYLAMTRGMNAGTAAIIMSLQPIVVAAVLTVLPTIGKGATRGLLLWVGLVMGVGGVALVVYAQDLLGPSGVIAIAAAICALSGICIATLFEKARGARTHPLIGAWVQYIVGAATLVPVALFMEQQVIDWQPELFVALAYLVVGNSIISVSLLVAMVHRGDATRVSSLMYLVPVLAAIYAWLLIGETLTPLAFVGFAITVAAVALINRRGKKH